MEWCDAAYRFRMAAAVADRADAAGLPARRAVRAPHDRRAAPPFAPFVLIDSGPRGLTLAAVDQRARAQGSRPGQSLADARAAVPALATRPSERAADGAALAALALWCGRYGPARNTQGDDGLWIDVTGVAHLFGGEGALLADLARRLGGFGLTARTGLADTLGAAAALARFAASDRQPFVIAPEGGARSAIAPLPVEALRLPDDCTVLLRRLGLGRIGDLYDLPRAALAQRFRERPPQRTGARARASVGKARARAAAQRAGLVLARLDQALASGSEPLVPLDEPLLPRVRHAFAEPLVSAAGVETAAAGLVIALAELLAAAGQGGSRFTLRLYRADGTCAEAGIGLSRPSRDPAHIGRLLAERLDALDAGFGVDIMTLAADRVETLDAAQIRLPARGLAQHGAEDTSALVDRLANRLGAAAIMHLVPAASHLPERAERRVSALSALPSAVVADPRFKAPRPAFLLQRPEPIEVIAEVPEGPPLRFTWRRVRRSVVRSEGPERIEPEWWRAIGLPPQRHGRVRDYYRIEDAAGGRYWLFRRGRYGDDDDAGPPRWFLHGLFA